LVRPILAPYGKIGKLDILNADTPAEIIALTNFSEKVRYECRWDRLILLLEGQKTNIFDSNGPFLYFDEILNQIKASPSFGKIENLVFAIYKLRIYDLDFKNVNERLQKKYLSENKLEDRERIGEEDFAIIHNYGTENDRALRFHFGPFRYESDNKNYALFPISQGDKEYREKNGILYEAIYFKKTDEYISGNVRAINLLVNNYIEQITIEDKS
jgi:hypothetical protein